VQHMFPSGTICRVLESVGNRSKIKIEHAGVEGWIASASLKDAWACEQRVLRHSDGYPNVEVIGQTSLLVPNGTMCLALHTLGDFTVVHVESFTLTGWVKTRNLANCQSEVAFPEPQPMRCQHALNTVTLLRPTNCSWCGAFLWGLTEQGKQCRFCLTIMCDSCVRTKTKGVYGFRG